MGAFYCNVAIRADPDQLAPKLVSGEFWLSHSGDWTVVVGQRVQDIEPAVALAQQLTRDLDTVALVSEVHDSDTLVLVAVSRGVVRGHYNSAPGYFIDEVEDRTDPPAGLPGHDLVLALQLDVDADQVEQVLRSTDHEVAYLFAENRHEALIQALALPLDASISASQPYVAAEPARYSTFRPVTA